jgi:hypothetical protein
MQRGTYAACSATSLFFAAGSRTADSRRRSHSDLRRARTVGPFHSRAGLSEGAFLFLLPAPGERFRGGLPGCLVTMRRRTIFILAVGERPHPGRPWRRRDGLEDAPDNKSARTDDVVVVGASLFAPRSALSSLSKQKVGHRPQSSSASRSAARSSGLIMSRLVAATALLSSTRWSSRFDPIGARLRINGGMTGCFLRRRARLASMGGAYQAEILVLTRAVESSRLEPHLVCAYPLGNEATTAIANKAYLDH